MQKNEYNNNKKTILSNLKETHNGKQVNISAALRGTKGSPAETFQALQDLLHEGSIKRIEHRVVTIKGKRMTVPLYQFNFMKL